MTHMEIIVERIKAHNYEITLADLMARPLGSEYRKYNTKLKRDGWTYTIQHDKKNPNNNLYTYAEPDISKPDQHREKYRNLIKASQDILEGQGKENCAYPQDHTERTKIEADIAKWGALV